MQTKSEIYRVFVFLYFVGVALLLAAFFLLVPTEWRTHSAWLDLTIVFIVFSINFPLASIWRRRSGSFNAKIPALGLLGICDLLYSCFAIGLVWFGIQFLLSFRAQLIGQMSFLFLAAVVATIAWQSSAHAVEVAEEEQDTRSGLEALKAAIAHCEAALFTAVPVSEQLRRRILELKQDARFLSPSRDASALLYEQQMSSLVDDIRLQLGNGSTALKSTQLDEQFEQCAALMALRKQRR